MLPLWYQEKLFAIFSCLISAVVIVMCYFHYESSLDYVPVPQQVLLDAYHRPIGIQDLLKDTSHNPHYKTGDAGETAGDFTKEMLLHLFTYDKEDLESGTVLSRFQMAFSEGEGESIYQKIFVNLSQPRIVMAQEAIVRARIIGSLEYVGENVWEYRTLSGLKLNSKTHQFKGKMMITVHGEETFPTLYTFVIEVQRALLQDKITGYQLLRMELN